VRHVCCLWDWAREDVTKGECIPLTTSNSSLSNACSVIYYDAPKSPLSLTANRAKTRTDRSALARTYVISSSLLQLTGSIFLTSHGSVDGRSPIDAAVEESAPVDDVADTEAVADVDDVADDVDAVDDDVNDVALVVDVVADDTPPLIVDDDDPLELTPVCSTNANCFFSYKCSC
jgi:hypothetical protein